MGRTRKSLVFGLALGATGGLCATAQAQSPLSLSGQVDFGFRAYPEAGLFAGQSGAGTGFFIGAELNASMGAGPGDVTLQFAALSDDRDGRSVLNLKKAHYTQVFDSWDLLVGYNVENWGVAESRSILNVINPVNATDLSYGQDRIGTPMINANFTTAMGTFSAYALVGFEQPNTPDRNARGRGPWGTHNNRAVYQEGNGRNLDVALRFANNYSLGDGSLDVSASYFNGTSRQPLGLPGCGYSSVTVSEAACDAINDTIVGLFEGGNPAATDSDALWDFLAANATDPILQALSAAPSVGFVPYYQKIQQVGLSAVYARGDLQLRFEGTYRQPKGEAGSFAAVVGGDYTWSNFAGSDGTLTLAVEYLYDNGDSRQPTSVFENDVFLGLNYLLNDTRDTRFQLGGFYDLDSKAQLYQLTLSTRLNDNMRAELSAVHVKTNGWNDPLAFIADDNFVQLRFSAFF